MSLVMRQIEYECNLCKEGKKFKTKDPKELENHVSKHLRKSAQ